MGDSCSVIKVSKRTLDVIGVLAEGTDLYIRTHYVSTHALWYVIGGLEIARSSLECLANRGIVVLGEIGTDSEKVEITSRGKEMFEKGLIRVEIQRKKHR